MRQVKLQKPTRKDSEVATKAIERKEERPKIVSKLERKEKVIFKDTPTKMATRPASAVPTKDLPSKLNAAVQKAKEYKSFDNMPKMKMKQTKSYKG